MKKEILKLHADFCKVFSSPKRLEILCALKEGELTVNHIAAKLGTSKENTSQHLSLMRTQRILTTRREGVNIYYGIANAKICQACSLMQEGMEQLFGVPAARRKAVGVFKEGRYDEDSKKCVDHVFS